MAEYICIRCGWEGERRKHLRGSEMVSNIMWWVFLIPGPFYSIWRHSGRSNDCPMCNLPSLRKTRSDEGIMAQRKFDIELGLITPPKKEETKIAEHFGNDKPAVERKKPIDPEQW
jgi:DNA-directed RNA polymerase subunit RPC12/RpoP